MKLSELLVRYLDIRDKLNSVQAFTAPQFVRRAEIRERLYVEATNILSQIDQIVERVDARLDNLEEFKQHIESNNE